MNNEKKHTFEVLSALVMLLCILGVTVIDVLLIHMFYTCGHLKIALLMTVLFVGYLIHLGYTIYKYRNGTIIGAITERFIK